MKRKISFLRSVQFVLVGLCVKQRFVCFSLNYYNNIWRPGNSTGYGEFWPPTESKPLSRLQQNGTVDYVCERTP